MAEKTIAQIRDLTVIPPKNPRDRKRQIVFYVGDERPYFATVQTWQAQQLQLALDGNTDIDHYDLYLAEQQHRDFRPIPISYLNEEEQETLQCIIIYDDELRSLLTKKRKIKDRFEAVTSHCEYMVFTAKKTLEEVEEFMYDEEDHDDDYYDQQEDKLAEGMKMEFTTEPRLKKKVRFNQETSTTTLSGD